jgi:fatty acid amide hydrolase
MRDAAQAELTSPSASELAALIASKRVSATEVVKAHIERIEALNGRLNAVVVPLFDEALAAAAEADRVGGEGKPLHGVPVTVKECFHVAGTPATIGLETKRNSRADLDAELVAKLKAAGAIVVGKTNVPQLLLYVESDNPVYGRTNNPWRLDRSPGGSSGGEAAALATGFSALGLGTDIGGSVRVPAHFSGVQSLRPTPHLLSLTGTEDEVLFKGSAVPDAAGPMARTVADLRMAMTVFGVELAEVDLKRLNVGFYEADGYFPASAACRRAVREAAATLEAAGCRVKRFEVPDIEEALALFYGSFTAEGSDPFTRMLEGSKRDERVKDLLLLSDLAAPVRPLMGGLYGLRGQRRVSQLIGWAGRRSQAQTAELLTRLSAYRERMLAALGDTDVLLAPACSVPAVTHGATRQLGPASICYTLLYNLVAWPAGVVAATRVRPEEQSGRPRSRDKVDDTARLVDEGSVGLPIGVQVVARPGRDDQIVTVMEFLEQEFRSRSDYPRTPIEPIAPG